MKKYFIYLMIGAMMSLSFMFVSCSDDDDDNQKAENVIPDDNDEKKDEAYYLKNKKDLNLVGEDAAKFDAGAYDRKSLNEDEKSVLGSVNDFSLRLFKLIEKAAGSGNNVLVSPYSVQQVLAMIANGADKAALQEIFTALGYEGTQEDYNAANRVILNQLKVSRDDCKLEIANAAWIDYELPVFKAFQSEIRNFYDSDVLGVDFSADDAGKMINSWCDDKTHGMIPEVVPDGKLPYELALANAVYFKAEWVAKFAEKLTAKEDFTNAAGKVSKVDMMHMDSPLYFRYADFPNVDVLSLPFRGDYEMMLLLPDKKDGLDDLIKEMDNEVWATTIPNNLKDRLVEIIIPKFKDKADMNLESALNTMGIMKVFNETDGLSRLSTSPLRISKMVQKTAIDVNEIGTEASAVTYAGVTSPGDEPGKEDTPVVFRADHPFMYVIYNKKTNAIMFMGSVKNL